MSALLATMGGLLVAAAVWALVFPAPRSPRTHGVPALPGVKSALITSGRRRRIRPEVLRRDAAAMMRQFAALLDSGRSEGQAWSDLLEHWRRRDEQHPFAEICALVTSAESAGLGAAQGLRRAAAQAQHPQLRDLLNKLIAVTELSEHTGTALSRLVEQLASSLDDSAEMAAAVQTAIAGPKLTQGMLTLLPVGGLVVGQLIGASPVNALLGSGIGLACLGAGGGLLILGRWWSARMIAGVSQHV